MKEGFLSETGWVVIQQTPNFSDEEETKVFHVMPSHDHIEHEISFRCWCYPYLDHKETKTGDEVVVHRCAKENPH